jgi:hypothetical protein
MAGPTIVVRTMQNGLATFANTAPSLPGSARSSAIRHIGDCRRREIAALPNNARQIGEPDYALSCGCCRTAGVLQSMLPCEIGRNPGKSAPEMAAARRRPRSLPLAVRFRQRTALIAGAQVRLAVVRLRAGHGALRFRCSQLSGDRMSFYYLNNISQYVVY